MMLTFDAFKRQDKFMHAGMVVRHREILLYLMHQVVGVEHCRFSGIPDAIRPKRQNIGQRPHDNAKVAVERANLADAFRFSSLAHQGVRQVGLQDILAANRAGARAAPAMRGGEGLVQVQVHHIKPHVSRPHLAHDGVQVCAVIVAQASAIMHQTRDFQDIGVEQAQRVGVRQHQAGDIIAAGGFQRLHIHTALRVGGNVDHAVSYHRRACGICAMCRIGHNDLAALGVTA